MNRRTNTRRPPAEASPPRRKRPAKRSPPPLRALPYHPRYAEIGGDFLPYGEYHTAAGARVVHGRFYRLLWRLKPDGEIEAVNPSEWLPHVRHDIFRDRDDQLDWKALDRVKAEWGIRSW